MIQGKRLELTAKLSRIILGVILIFAAVMKGMDLVRFQREIELLLESFRLPPTDLIAIASGVVAGLTLLIEFAIGSMLVLNYRSRHTSIYALLLLVSFSAVIVWVILSDSVTDCGCFGVLLKRSPYVALLEDGLMIGLSLLSLMSHVSATVRRGKAVGIMFLASCVWMAVFYIFPPSWAAMKPGKEWSYPNQKVLADKTGLYWLFDPNCHECQSQVRYLNRIAAADIKLTGLTESSAARIAEFELDFEPIFNIEQIDSGWIDNNGLRLGNLIQVSGEKIVHIWHPQRLPDILELTREHTR